MEQTADTQADLQNGMRELDRLLGEIDRISDPSVHQRVVSIIQRLMDFHGEALSRMMAKLAESEPAGRSLLDQFADDELISNLLLLYGLHPRDLLARVRAALEKSRPYLASHGGNVELRGITDDGIVRLELQGSCHGCPSSLITLKNSIEQAILEQAPDVAGIEVQGLENNPPAEPPRAADGFVPVEALLAHRGAGHHQLTPQGAI